MKRRLTILYVLGFFAWVFSSCTVEHISNGDLDGFWHFVEIDTLSTGVATDLSSETLFWGFQAKLMHTQGAADKFYFRFDHTGSILVIYDPYLDHGHQDKEDGGDMPVTDPSVLAPYGIESLSDTFRVETLSSSRMTLSTATHRLYFIKF